MDFYPTAITSDEQLMEVVDLNHVFFAEDAALDHSLLQGIFEDQYYVQLRTQPERNKKGVIVRDGSGNAKVLDYRQELSAADGKSPADQSLLPEGLKPLWFYYQTQGLALPDEISRHLFLFDKADLDESPYVDQKGYVVNQFAENDLRIMVADEGFYDKVQRDREAIYQRFMAVQAQAFKKPPPPKK
jgi:hypothetical protein